MVMKPHIFIQYILRFCIYCVYLPKKMTFNERRYTLQKGRQATVLSTSFLHCEKPSYLINQNF